MTKSELQNIAIRMLDNNFGLYKLDKQVSEKNPNNVYYYLNDELFLQHNTLHYNVFHINYDMIEPILIKFLKFNNNDVRKIVEIWLQELFGIKHYYILTFGIPFGVRAGWLVKNI